MKALKIFGTIILIIVAAFLIIPLFLPSEVAVSETQFIKAKPEVVFRQVNELKKWFAWSPFEDDTTTVNTFEGPDRGIGAKRSWKGDKSGEGTLTIAVSRPYEYIENQLTFGENQKAIGSWSFVPRDDGTEVTWTLKTVDLQYPFGKWMGLMMNSLLQPMLEKGLKKLKTVAESLPEPPVVKVIDTDEIRALVINDSATFQGMGEMFQKDYQELYSYLKRKQIPITGERFAIYHDWNPKGYTHISPGIPVGKKVKDYGRIKYLVVPAGKAVFAVHIGGFDTAPEHYAIDEYIKDFNLKLKDFIWETYAFNPVTDTDSTQWKTLIYYPIK
ncbi:MAG: hypothetical protein GXO86_02065 [Chlorobi bacterium]|nr:hypothetical protein [Chlorobiota bacterium]